MARDKVLGRQKAALLLISLGPEQSAQVMKNLGEEEIEQLTLEIANVRKVDAEQKSKIFEEFYQLYMANEYIAKGGIDYAKNVLEKALGNNKAVSIINKLTSSLQVKPFDFVRKADPTQLVTYIQNEHPQTVALILAYLDPDQSASILSSLPGEMQSDVSKRIALLDRTSPEIIKDIEDVLEKKLSNFMVQDFTSAGGVESIVQILNKVDRSTEKAILENLEVQDPELTDEIKRLMFVFEDIILLDDKDIQKVLRDIEQKDLAFSLKGTTDEVKEKIKKNMSKRAAETIQEEIDFMGPVRLRDVEESQQRVVATIRRLEDAGEIIVARGGGDDIVV